MGGGHETGKRKLKDSRSKEEVRKDRYPAVLMLKLSVLPLRVPADQRLMILFLIATSHFVCKTTAATWQR